MAVLVEATGSLWSSVLMHVIFNAQSVLLMYFYQHFMPEVWLQQTQAAVTAEDMLPLIGIYLVIAVVCTAWQPACSYGCAGTRDGMNTRRGFCRSGKAERKRAGWSACRW